MESGLESKPFRYSKKGGGWGGEKPGSVIAADRHLDSAVTTCGALWMGRISEFEWALEPWNQSRVGGKLDGACLAWDATDEAALLQPDEHRIH